MRAGLDTFAYRNPSATLRVFEVVYLTRESVMQTLAFVASAPGGSELVLSYVVSASKLGDRTAELGERWLTFFDPTSLANDLRRLGFGDIEDLGAEQANRRYFGSRTDGLRVGGSGHLVKARVGA